jgi:release factor glutamine methyltransferase
MTVQQALTEGKRRLSLPCPSAFIDTPALDASLLLAKALSCKKEDLIVRAGEKLSEAECDSFFAFIERRIGGECIAYILGRREFRGLDFIVNHHVLVPRPDSETLVEVALRHIKTIQLPVPSVLDLCTGSGALAASLKNENPLLSITASDICCKALETAALNAKRLLGSSYKDLKFVQSDLFENIREKFHIIVCNPPYIPNGELGALAPELRREPALALNGGLDGLELIRKVIHQARNYLLPDGALILEADPGQMAAISALLKERKYNDTRLYKDLAGRERAAFAIASYDKVMGK